MMATRTTLLGNDLVASHCIICGVFYVVPAALWDEQQKMGGMHHCINGHKQGWKKGGTEFDKVKRERDRLHQMIAQKDDEIATERRATARARGETTKAKNEITRQKKRAAAGVCSCCHRTFSNLARHMETKHNDSPLQS